MICASTEANGRSATASSVALAKRARRSFSRHFITTFASAKGTFAGSGAGLRCGDRRREPRRCPRPRTADAPRAPRRARRRAPRRRFARRRRAAFDLLRRHVARRAERDVRRRLHRRASLDCSFEIPKSSTLTQRRSVRARREEQIRRLQIAVHDAERVRFRERLARLNRERRRFARRQRAVAVRAALRDPRRRAAPSRCTARPSRRRPTSNTRTTCSLFTCAHARASRAKRSQRARDRLRFVAQELDRDALHRARCASPRRTTPIPPCPSTRSTRYFPWPRSAPIAGSAIGDGDESAMTVGAEPVVMMSRSGISS